MYLARFDSRVRLPNKTTSAASSPRDHHSGSCTPYAGNRFRESVVEASARESLERYSETEDRAPFQTPSTSQMQTPPGYIF